jgi:uncharacterized protein YkwD
MRSGTKSWMVGLALVPLLGCGVSGEDDQATASAAISSGCPMPAGASAEALSALEEVNRTRRDAGLGCVAFAPEIASAAERHCQYFVSNAGRCTAKPHREVADCKSFTAETFSDRLRMASYKGEPRFEVMAYVGQGRLAVRQWIDSVWHRIPILSPDVDQLGYGTAGRCDTMDFGAEGNLVTKNILYPYDGQVNVPRSFGGRESPEPPVPPSGWPSGYPVSLNAAGLKNITEHSIVVDGTKAPLPHTWLAPGDMRAGGLLVDEFFLYTHKPLAAKTRYRVRIVGTQPDLATQVDAPAVFEWTFTTD